MKLSNIPTLKGRKIFYALQNFRAHILLFALMLNTVQVKSQQYLNELFLIRILEAGKEDHQKAVMKLTKQTIDNKYFKFKIDTLSKDTIVFYNWDPLRGWALGNVRKGVLKYNKRDSLFFITSITDVHICKMKSDTLSIRKFKVLQWDKKYLILKDLDYPLLLRKYVFKEKKKK